jgi:hypothetical protein
MYEGADFPECFFFLGRWGFGGGLERLQAYCRGDVGGGAGGGVREGVDDRGGAPRINNHEEDGGDAGRGNQEGRGVRMEAGGEGAGRGWRWRRLFVWPWG